MTIAHSTLAQNDAFELLSGGEGGGIKNSGHVTISASTLFDNRAATSGGGIDTVGTLTVVNSTLAQNLAGRGGGIHNWGTLDIKASTLANNQAFAGGGISNDAEDVWSVTLLNTILANAPGGNCDGNPITSDGHNLATDDTCNLVNVGDRSGVANPGLGFFTDDGTPGRGHFLLLLGSPAINMGDDTACTTVPVLNTDQLGNARDGVCDIGAIEFTLFALIEGLEELTRAVDLQHNRMRRLLRYLDLGERFIFKALKFVEKDEEKKNGRKAEKEIGRRLGAAQKQFEKYVRFVEKLVDKELLDPEVSAELIKEAVKISEQVELVGFGTFKVSRRKARKGRNPQTGEEIKIKAKKVPEFVGEEGKKSRK